MNLARDKLLTRLEQSYAEFAALLDRFSGGQTGLTGVPGYWLVKDVLAHIIAHLHQARMQVSTAKHSYEHDAEHTHHLRDG